MSHAQIPELTTAQLDAIVRLIERAGDDSAQWRDLAEARAVIQRVLIVRRIAAGRLADQIGAYLGDTARRGRSE